MTNNQDRSPQLYETPFWEIKDILRMLRASPPELHIRPPFQRRSVWSASNRYQLIDSIARGVPCGSLSVQRLVHIDDAGNETDYWEVIDGQQRILAIFDYFNDVLKIPAHNWDETDEVPPTEWSEAITQSGSFSELNRLNSTLARTLQLYKFPILEITPGNNVPLGVATFLRMNKNVVPLNDNEIRHAAHVGKPMATKIEELSEELDRLVPEGSRRGGVDSEKKSFFEHLRIISEADYTRMGDYDILTGLAVYADERMVADRREKYGDTYGIQDSQRAIRIIEQVKNSLSDLLWLCSDQNQANHNIVNLASVKNKQHHIYDIPGVFILGRRVQQRQRSDLTLKTEIQELIKRFLVHEVEYKRELKKSRTGKTQAERHAAEGKLGEFPEAVKRYSGSFSGQQNSRENRKIRNETFTAIFQSVYSLAQRSNFTSEDKELIWVRNAKWVSAENKYIRTCEASPNHCENRIVNYRDYEIGHITPSQEGGSNSLGNGRIECRDCNRRNH